MFWVFPETKVCLSCEELRKGPGSSDTGIRGVYEWPRCWTVNLGPLEEQQEPSPEPALQPTDNLLL